MKKISMIVLLLAVALVLAGICFRKKAHAPENVSPSASASMGTDASSAEENETGDSLPTATPNEKIRYTEGRVLDTEKPSVEGPVVSISEEELSVSISGKPYVFLLGENGKRDIGYFNKNPEQPRIMKGTILIVNYENVGKDKVVQSLEIVESN